MSGESEEKRDGPPKDGDGPGWLRKRFERLEGLAAPEIKLTMKAGEYLVPAWRRVTEGEPRWQVSIAIAAAIFLQYLIPSRLVIGPRGVVPTVEGLLLIGLLIANPGRLILPSRQLRMVSLALIALMSLDNAASAVALINGLIRGTEGKDPGQLLLVGSAIWLTNVLVFALWYWELDRGGPVARALGVQQYPDFLFPQMSTPEVAPADWEPLFPDYFYLSFTNATAFSPTDTMPLTRWTKMFMFLQSAISLSTVALVIARAVNILK